MITIENCFLLFHWDMNGITKAPIFVMCASVILFIPQWNDKMNYQFVSNSYNSINAFHETN